MRLTNKWLRAMYDEFNGLYFGGHLPTKEMTVVFSPMKVDSGLWEAYTDGTYGITINTNMQQLRTWMPCLTLLHEMAHMRCEQLAQPDHVEHGPSFRLQIWRLQEQGAFDEYL